MKRRKNINRTIIDAAMAGQSKNAELCDEIDRLRAELAAEQRRRYDGNEVAAREYAEQGRELTEARRLIDEAKSSVAYPTITYYEEITGYSVNEAFRIGWNMARTTNAMLGIYDAEPAVKELLTTVPAQPAIPDDVVAALERMCTPLDDSWLGSESATAKEDARCMGLIRRHILRREAAESAVKESLTTAVPADAAKDAARLGKEWHVRQAEAERNCNADVGAGFVTLPIDFVRIVGNES